MNRHPIERRRAYLQTRAASREKETDGQTLSREKKGLPTETTSRDKETDEQTSNREKKGLSAETASLIFSFLRFFCFFVCLFVFFWFLLLLLLLLLFGGVGFFGREGGWLINVFLCFRLSFLLHLFNTNYKFECMCV